MRSTHRLGIALFAFCGAAFFVAPTLGQNQKTEKAPTAPSPAPGAPTTPAPQRPAAEFPELFPGWGAFRVTVAQGAPNWRLNLDINGAPVVAMLEAITKEVGRNVIISDDVRLTNPSLSAVTRVTNVTPDEAVAQVVKLASLAWGKAGNDTYLVVSRPMVPPLVVAPPALRLLPPPLTHKPQPGRPFTFNGQTYYMVPLTKER